MKLLPSAYPRKREEDWVGLKGEKITGKELKYRMVTRFPTPAKDVRLGGDLGTLGDIVFRSPTAMGDFRGGVRASGSEVSGPRSAPLSNASSRSRVAAVAA